MHRQYSHKREKIIQWLRLTWDLRDLFLILSYATGFLSKIYIYIYIFLYIYTVEKAHKALSVLSFKCRPESKSALLSCILDGSPHSAKDLVSFEPPGQRLHLSHTGLRLHLLGQTQTYSAIP